VVLKVTSRVYARQSFPWDWLSYLAILIPATSVSGVLASLAWGLISGRGEASLSHPDWSEIRTTIFVSVVSGMSIYVSRRGRTRLEERNRELESQVTLGQIELKTHEAESRAAHEIQTHLLPCEIPRVKGFDVACAWQPARSVGGDYFDVLALGPGRIGVCLADVSGKGIGAALLMANLQATVRAFAPGIAGPGALCRKVNEVLCGSVAPGKFVTLFYGVLDSETLTLRFENAAHTPPIVLRGDSANRVDGREHRAGDFSARGIRRTEFRFAIGRLPAADDGRSDGSGERRR
jgi:sigma-B regulation protein RsbU (phosphoserine phosphatase)